MEDTHMNDYLINYPPVLDISQTAEILGVGSQLVRKAIADREIPAIKVGRIYRIPKSKLIEYLDNTLDITGDYHGIN